MCNAKASITRKDQRQNVSQTSNLDHFLRCIPLRFVTSCEYELLQATAAVGNDQFVVAISVTSVLLTWPVFPTLRYPKSLFAAVA